MPRIPVWFRCQSLVTSCPIQAGPIDVNISVQHKSLILKGKSLNSKESGYEREKPGVLPELLPKYQSAQDKTFKAVIAALCKLCGDEWATTHVGWNAEISVCLTCSAKLSKWDREKEMARRQMEALCQVLLC